MRGAKPPDGLGWGDPAAQKLGLFWVAPKYICDGKMVYQNTVTVADYLNTGTNGATTVKWQASPSVTPQALLSVEGRGYGLVPNATIVSLVYPDLSPRRGWGFEFDPRPADAPACVLIKISAHLATKEPTVGHEWYYIDPSKGYAVVRAEYFNLPANVPADPKAAERKSTTRMDDFQQSPQGFWYPKLVHESDSRTVHYHFDFDVAVPDSLFVIGDTGKPKK
jgi:hypothetical protein